MNIIPLAILAAGGLILTVGDIIMKRWVITANQWFYLAGLFIWLIGLTFLAASFKYKNIAVASTIFVLINVITLAIFSWFVLNEKLTSTQIIGIGFGLVAIIILEIY